MSNSFDIGDEVLIIKDSIGAPINDPNIEFPTWGTIDHRFNDGNYLVKNILEANGLFSQIPAIFEPECLKAFNISTDPDGTEVHTVKYPCDSCGVGKMEDRYYATTGRTVPVCDMCGFKKEAQ